MDKNYFSDITELFIKAKKAEKIDINPHSKAAIREMLAYKIDQIKTAEANPQESFFNKWKFQLMSVPASVFAVFLLVFAFQNLQITMPKEDFAPGANEVSSMERSEAESSESIFGEYEDSDTPVIEEIEIKEEPKPIPELLVIDYGETTTPISTKSSTSYTSPATVAAPEASSDPYVAPTYIQPEPTTEKQTAQSAQGYPNNSSSSGSSGGSSSNTTTTTTPSTTAPTYDIYTPTTDNGYVMISNDPTEGQDLTPNLVTPPEVDIPGYEMNPDTVNGLMNGGIRLPKTENPDGGSINEYRDPFNPLVPEFDTGVLNTIEKTDTLNNVNVHYLNRDQAAVEVIDTNSTRWYMFEAIDGKWIVTQKFD